MTPNQREKKYFAETTESVACANADAADREATQRRFGDSQDVRAREARLMDRERSYWRATISRVYLGNRNY